MKVSFDVPNSRITDLIHGHGGSYSPWLHSLSGKWDDHGALAIYDREEDEEGEGKGNMKITREKVQKGLARMMKECPKQFAQFMQEQDDDLTFDCALQCIIFGKLVYA